MAPRHFQARRVRADPGRRAAQLSQAALATPDEVRALLIAAARSGSAVGYGELLELLGYQFSRPRMRALCRLLEAVDEECRARSEPELAVLVVRGSDGLPGQGWWVGKSARGSDYGGRWTGPGAARLVALLQAVAFRNWPGPAGGE